jgi:chromosome segregation ATPase
MTELIKKEDIKEVLTEVLEPYRFDERFEKIDERFERMDKRFEKIDERFERMDKRFEKIETTLIAMVENLKEAEKERQELKAKINETYNAVDGFIKIVDKLETEFTAIKEDLKRVKEVIKEKLGVNLF